MGKGKYVVKYVLAKMVACEKQKKCVQERNESVRIHVHGALWASTSTPCAHQHFLVLEIACRRLEFQEKFLEFGWMIR